MLELPIVIPKYQTIPRFTSGLAILYAWDKEIADAWVANNCISAVFIEYIENPSRLFLLPMYTLLNCCLFDVYRYPYKKIGNMNEFIEDLLSDGFYLSTFIDAFYLPSYVAVYKESHSCHQILIYGKSGNSLKVADHIIGGDGTFRIFEVEYSMFYESMVSAHEVYLNKMTNSADIYAIRVKKELANYHFSSKALKSSLANYLGSEIIIGNNWPNEMEYFGNSFGYSALLRVLNYFKDNLYNYHFTYGAISFVRLAHELYTHVSIVLLASKMSKCKKLIQMAEMNLRNSLLMRNSLLKFAWSGDWSRSGFVLNDLESIINSDHAICSGLYESIIV